MINTTIKNKRKPINNVSIIVPTGIVASLWLKFNLMHHTSVISPSALQQLYDFCNEDMADDDEYFKWSSDGTSFWFPNVPAFEEDMLAAGFVVSSSTDNSKRLTCPVFEDFASFKRQLLSLGRNQLIHSVNSSNVILRLPAYIITLHTTRYIIIRLVQWLNEISSWQKRCE